MSIVLDPNKSFVTIQVLYIEEEDKKHGNSRYYFINSKNDLAKWKAKGYQTEEEIEKASAVPDPKQPGMPVPPPVDPTKVVQILRTWWTRMNWKEQNQIYAQCLRQVPGEEGASRTELDMISYRDMKLKTCLKRWDLKDDNGQDVEITEVIIDQLVPEVAQELLNNFELVTEAGEDDLKN